MTLYRLAAALALFGIAGVGLAVLAGVGGYAVTRTVRTWLRDHGRTGWLLCKPLSCNVCMSWWTTVPTILAATALTCLAAWSWWGLVVLLAVPLAAGTGMILLRYCGGKTERLFEQEQEIVVLAMPAPFNTDEVVDESEKHEEVAGGGVPEQGQSSGDGR